MKSLLFILIWGGLFITSGSSMLDTPPKMNMTMENQPWMKMYLVSKIVIFHCHVGFQGGNSDFFNCKAFSGNRDTSADFLSKVYIEKFWKSITIKAQCWFTLEHCKHLLAWRPSQRIWRISSSPFSRKLDGHSPPWNKQLGGGFKDFLFSPLFGEDFQFDSYFSTGSKPPTRKSSCWKRFSRKKHGAQFQNIRVRDLEFRWHPWNLNSSPLKIGRAPKGNSSSNHHFSGANC